MLAAVRSAVTFAPAHIVTRTETPDRSRDHFANVSSDQGSSPYPILRHGCEFDSSSSVAVRPARRRTEVG